MSLPNIHYMKIGTWVVPGKRLNVCLRQDTGDNKWYYYLAVWIGAEWKWVRVGRQQKEYGPFVSFQEAMSDGKRVASTLQYTPEALANCVRFQ